MTAGSASVEEFSDTAGTALLREYLLQVDADRPKHIDDYIDYFGTGSAIRAVPPGTAPRGERDGEGPHGVSRRRPPGGLSG